MFEPINGWQKTIQECISIVVATGCVVVVLLMTANNPSADEFWRGIPAALIGYGGAKVTGAFSKRGQ